MNESAKAKIKHFLDDEEMTKAVHSILKHRFLRPPVEKDVQFLAASWLAKDLFDEAWKELLRLKNDHKRDEKEPSNVGL